MKVILENGGLDTNVFKDSGEAWSSLIFFNHILNTIAKADDIDELSLRMTSIFADFRLHNKPTPFTYGFNEDEETPVLMEVFQDYNPKRLILIKNEE